MTQEHSQQPYPAHKARQGVVILRTPAERAIFIASLAGAVALALMIGWLAT